MAALDRKELLTLLESNGSDSHVSLYMPTVKTGPETQQNPIRFKNLLRAAHQHLQELNVGAEQREQLLARADTLLDDRQFWQYTDAGFALFASTALFRYYHLPISCDELVVAGQRFYLKPLLSLTTADQRFYILALSQNAIRLLNAGPYSASEVDLGDIPVSLAEALGDELTEQHLQFHSGGGQDASPVYHAQGSGEDDIKPEIRKFFAKVDTGIKAHLGGDDTPLVLAGVERLLSLYRDVSQHKTIMPQGVTGNPEYLQADELHASAWPIVENYFARAQETAIDRYYQLAASDQASDQLDEVLPAALDGRVDTLFIDRHQHCWGSYDPQQRRLKRHQEPLVNSEDLLDLAAARTYLQGGKVLVWDNERVPGAGTIAAIYRY